MLGLSQNLWIETLDLGNVS